MIPYKKLSLEDRGWVQEKLRQSGFRGSEYCFVNQYLWGGQMGMEAALVEGCLCTVYTSDRPEALHDFPAGRGKLKQAVERLLEDDRRRGKVPVIRGILEESRQWMEESFPSVFSYEEKREEWDYLYRVEKLAQLKGRKFHGKRNHIARFKENGEWAYEEMGTENIPDCREMYHYWLTQNKGRLDASIQKEIKVVEGCFDHFGFLGLSGGIIRREGKVAAFCIGEPLTEDTFIVHIEKGDTDIQGAYPMINQQFLVHGMEGFAYVNREDDLGQEGLRRAKLSYQPELLLKKYSARLIQ